MENPTKISMGDDLTVRNSSTDEIKPISFVKELQNMKCQEAFYEKLGGMVDPIAKPEDQHRIATIRNNGISYDLFKMQIPQSLILVRNN